MIGERKGLPVFNFQFLNIPLAIFILTHRDCAVLVNTQTHRHTVDPDQTDQVMIRGGAHRHTCVPYLFEIFGKMPQRILYILTKLL